MKILFTVEFYEPKKGGAEEVVKQLAERFFEAGHEVFVATTKVEQRQIKILRGVKIEEFSISGNLVRGIKAEESEIKRYRDFVLSGFDVVINYAAQIWTTDLCFEILDQIKSKKVMVPCGYSGLNWSEYKRYFEKLPEYLKKYDHLVYMSFNYQDKVFGDLCGVTNKAILIPNGASEKEFLNLDSFDLKKSLDIKTKYLAISVANHYSAKGHDFVIEAFKKMKREDLSLLIIGEVPGQSGFWKLAHLLRGCYKNCFVSSHLIKNLKLMSGQDRQKVLSAYRQADLFLFGSKIECAPLVMYESFASKALFITREVGNVKDHQEILKIVKTPEEMAETSNYYLDHQKEREKIIDLAFSEWQANYTWDKIFKSYEKMIV